MNAAIRKPLRIALAAMIGVGALFVNEQVAQMRTRFFVSEAEAIIGRPLTPLSYAGVARRTTRRAYGYGAAGVGVYGAPVVGAPVVYGAPVYGGGCYQTVDAYGRVYTRCP
jgi:hypothetical protein